MRNKIRTPLFVTILFSYLFLLPIVGLGQESVSDHKSVRPPFTLKTTPLNLLNPVQQSVDIAADIPFSSRWGVELGVNVVINSLPLARFNGESYQGFKLRPIIKYYIQRSEQDNLYIGLAFKYNDIYNDRYVDVMRQGGQYVETMLLRNHFVTSGVALRVGYQTYLGKHKWGIIEPFWSLGLRQQQITYTLPPDAEVVDRAGLYRNRMQGTYNTPDLMLGFSIGWSISH